MKEICTLINISNNFIIRLLTTLDSDIRRDIFIGVTGLMIAIIIFIAEIISNKDHDLKKRVILNKTKIISNMKFCIIVFFLFLIASLVESPYKIPKEASGFNCPFLYIINQIALNIMILIFLYRTFKMFKIAVKLNINKEYFSEEIDKYVCDRTVQIEREATEKSLKNIKESKKQFENYIKKNNILSNNIFILGFSEHNYLPIYAKKKGIIKSYDYKKIDIIIENINNNSVENLKEYISTDNPVFIFAKQVGDNLERNNIVGYCLKGYKEYFKEFSECIILDQNSLYLDDEVKLINTDMFAMTNNDFHELSYYDENNKLFNYINHLYSNNLYGIKEYAISQLSETARKFYKNKFKNSKYVSFLSNILSLAYNNDDFMCYQKVSGLIYFLYYQQLQITGADIKQVAYDFSNQYFKFNYFSVNKGEDTRYYDQLMANLLKFICGLIKEKRFDAIPVVFKNVLLEQTSFLDEEINQKEIINFQFACGIIYSLILYTNANKVNEQDREIIIKIIDWSRSYFVNIYNAWEIIINFRTYFNTSSSVQRVYNHFDLDFVDHKYSSSWSSWSMDEKLILREFLCTYKIFYIDKDNIDFEKITKNDKFYFEQLLETFKKNEKTKLEKYLKLDFENIYEDSLLVAISYAEQKEKEYFKQNKLDKEKVDTLKKIIIEEIYQNNNLESYLCNNEKIENCDKKLKRVVGINQLLPRKVFFKEIGGYESIAKQFGSAFKKRQKEEFIKKIEDVSEAVNEDINSLLNHLENLENYVLITNNISCRHIKNYDRKHNNITINNKKIDVLILPETSNMYLIEKQYLPILQYCSFDENFSQQYIEDAGLYYEFNDCSANETLRNELIKNTRWLAEKGDVYEQHEYLKQQCQIRIFLAFRYQKVKNSKALKITIDPESNI